MTTQTTIYPCADMAELYDSKMYMTSKGTLRYTSQLRAARRCNARVSGDPELRAKEAERCRAWRVANPDKSREASRVWAEANPEKHRERSRVWAEANRDKKNAIKATREARKRDSIPAGVDPKDVAKAVTQMRRWARQMKDVTGRSYHIDHIIAITNGGAHAPTNFQICDANDNKRKGNVWTFSDYRFPRILHPDAAALYAESGFLEVGEVWTIEQLQEMQE